MLGSQWFLVLAENQLRPLYHCTWYIYLILAEFLMKEKSD